MSTSSSRATRFPPIVPLPPPLLIAHWPAPSESGFLYLVLPFSGGKFHAGSQPTHTPNIISGLIVPVLQSVVHWAAMPIGPLVLIHSSLALSLSGVLGSWWCLSMLTEYGLFGLSLLVVFVSSFSTGSHVFFPCSVLLAGCQSSCTARCSLSSCCWHLGGVRVLSWFLPIGSCIIGCTIPPRSTRGRSLVVEEILKDVVNSWLEYRRSLISCSAVRTWSESILVWLNKFKSWFWDPNRMSPLYSSW